MAELTYEEIKTLLIEVAAKMDYEELKDFSGEVTEMLRVKSYAKGYREGFTDGRDETDKPTKFKPVPHASERDRIVARAKEDIDGGIPKNGKTKRGLTGYAVGIFVADVEFVVNREKRTVVALMRGVEEKEVIDKGIAKCAPEDCFNEYIGKAIALRRALGMKVPEEYLNAPQPEGKQVGDVIAVGGSIDNKYTVVDIKEWPGDGKTEIGSIGCKRGRVIDDSARYK